MLSSHEKPGRVERILRAVVHERTFSIWLTRADGREYQIRNVPERLLDRVLDNAVAKGETIEIGRER